MKKIGAIFGICLTLFVAIFGMENDNSSIADSGSSFYFVQISDTHWGKGDNLSQTAKVVKAINELPFEIKCVVHTGDITEEALGNQVVLDSGLAIMETLTMPVHYVSGNNDVTGDDTTLVQFRKHFGELISVNEYQGVLMVSITTEPLRSGDSLGSYFPMVELEKVLKESSGKPVIIAHHGACVDDFYANKMHTSWDSKIRDQWIELLNNYKVTAVLAGHFHRDEMHWLGSVPLYICASVDESWGRQSSFKLFQYEYGKLSYRTQYIQ